MATDDDEEIRLPPKAARMYAEEKDRPWYEKFWKGLSPLARALLVFIIVYVAWASWDTKPVANLYNTTDYVTNATITALHYKADDNVPKRSFSFTEAAVIVIVIIALVYEVMRGLVDDIMFLTADQAQEQLRRFLTKQRNLGVIKSFNVDAEIVMNKQQFGVNAPEMDVWVSGFRIWDVEDGVELYYRGKIDPRTARIMAIEQLKKKFEGQPFDTVKIVGSEELQLAKKGAEWMRKPTRRGLY